MNKKFKKTLSFILTLAVMIVFYGPCVSAKAAEKKPDSKLQTQVAILSKSLDCKKYKVKINNDNKVEIYTNEVARINASARAASGLRYGSWFGGADSVYAMSTSEEMKLALILFAALNPFLSASKSVVLKAAQSIAAVLGMTITVKPGHYVKVDRRKQYREVTYSDGSFAYWQTKIGASVTDRNNYLGYGDTIISGGMW